MEFSTLAFRAPQWQGSREAFSKSNGHPDGLSHLNGYVLSACRPASNHYRSFQRFPNPLHARSCGDKHRSLSREDEIGLQLCLAHALLRLQVAQ